MLGLEVKTANGKTMGDSRKPVAQLCQRDRASSAILRGGSL